ncbi:hypothetical protein N7507_007913 [Penicillium longicatenatum]|nr:hypothetical protein N7507_007913 [Penicillium longicatenatum]
MDMMEITALYSPCPEDRHTTASRFNLKTKRSPKLGDLTSRFIATQKPFYNCKDLRAHGVDAIALPDICSLSSEGCHFKPLDSLGSITAAYPSIDTHYKIRRPGPYAALDEKPIISCLEPIQYGERTGLTPSKVIQDNGYWNEIQYGS